MSLWDMFSSLFGRKDEEVRQEIDQESQEIDEIAQDPLFDGWDEMGQIPPTPDPGEDEADTGKHEAQNPNRHWWELWK